MLDFFERLLEPFPKEEPAQPPQNIIKFLRHYSKGAEKLLLIMSVLTGVIAILEVSLFAFLGQLLDWIRITEPDIFWQQHRTELFSMAAVILIVLPHAILFHSMIVHQTLLGNYPMAIRWQTHRYLLGQSYGFFHDEFAGRIATKVMQTSLAIREAVIKLLDVILYVAVYFTTVFIVFLALDLRLLLPLIAWLVLYITLLRHYLPKLTEISSNQADARADMAGRLVDTYTNIGTVKLFSHNNREAAYAKESMQKFLHTVHPQMRLATELSVMLWSLNALLIFTVAGLSLWLWTDSAISAGAIAVAIGLVLRLYGMSQWIMWEISSFFENLGTAKDGMNTLAKPRQVRDKRGAIPIKVNAGHIVFDKVKFQYDKNRTIFSELSLKINAGEKVGIVGRSGAGKSTLVNLLLRFYDISAGNIVIDGHNIQEVTQASLRNQIGVVTQDTSMLHRSIRENLLYGKPSANEQEMLRAADQAKAHEFILTLEDNEGRLGYDAYAGERGVKLSGGQRQRIAIARAILKNAPILILDEATSALDSEVEASIQDSFNEVMKDKTVIAIAHRLSTIAAMDRLIVIDNGKIVEQGTHEQLVENRGIYAQLWAHQSGGFLGDL